jgi:hypothetical protein
MIFPIKRQPLYAPMLGSYGGGSARAFGMSVGVGGLAAINISSSDTPNFHSPQFTRSNSGSWVKPAGLADKTIVHILLVGSGGGGNSTYYSNKSSWKFAGGGGSALLFITTAGIANGLSCNIAAGGGPSGTWRSKRASANTIIIGGTTYSTNFLNVEDVPQGYAMIGDGETLFTCESGFTNEFYTIGTQSETTTLVMTDGSTNKETVYRKGYDTGALSTQGGGGMVNRILGAGNGYATYGGTGWESSQYSGNGASGIANGVYPGGGASYARTGAGGSLRVYY